MSRTDRPNTQLLYIQTDTVSVSIKGSALPPARADKGRVSSLRVCCDTPFEAELAGDARRQAYRELGHACIADYALCPLFFEGRSYELVIEAESGHTAGFFHPNAALRGSVTPVGRDGRRLSGVLSFGNDVGLSDLTVTIDGNSFLKLTVEVFPSIMRYADDYTAMREEVAAEMTGLLFDFLRKTYSPLELSPRRRTTPTEFFSVIRGIYERFLRAADLVLQRPRHCLRTEYSLAPGYKLRSADAVTRAWLEKHPACVRREEGRLAVTRALAASSRVSFDTAENRLVKTILEDTAKRLTELRRLYALAVPETDTAVLTQLDGMTAAIRRRTHTGVLAELDTVKENAPVSLVFGMASGYRELYRAWSLLRHGLSLHEGAYRISTKDVAALYETWCFLRLHTILKTRCRLMAQNAVRLHTGGLSVALAQGRESRVQYLDPKSGEIIALCFKPDGEGSPDIVLTLKKQGSERDCEYFFNVRYALNEAGTGPADSDIHELYGLRSEKRTVLGAYLLFPYGNAGDYREHRHYKSISETGVGGLPLLPEESSLLEELLDELLADSPVSAFERAVLPVKTEEHLARVRWERRDVLIGSFRSREQYACCMSGRFYYIPAERIAEDSLPIRYVAPFRTPRVFGDEAGIDCVGEVLRCALVRRRSIREIPMRPHADPDALYYRFSVREWLPLGRTIRPQESAFVSAFTNTFLLQYAELVPELLLRSETEYRFYYELKRRAESLRISDDGGSPGFELDGLRVLFADGCIRLIREDSVIGECSADDFTAHPTAVLRKLLENASACKETML